MPKTLNIPTDPEASLATLAAATAFAGFEKMGRGVILLTDEPTLSAAGAVWYMPAAWFETIAGAGWILEALRAYDPEREFLLLVWMGKDAHLFRQSVKNPDNGPRMALEELRVGELLRPLEGQPPEVTP